MKLLAFLFALTALVSCRHSLTDQAKEQLQKVRAASREVEMRKVEAQGNATAPTDVAHYSTAVAKLKEAREQAKAQGASEAEIREQEDKGRMESQAGGEVIAGPQKAVH